MVHGGNMSRFSVERRGRAPGGFLNTDEVLVEKSLFPDRLIRVRAMLGTVAGGVLKYKPIAFPTGGVKETGRNKEELLGKLLFAGLTVGLAWLHGVAVRHTLDTINTLADLSLYCRSFKTCRWQTMDLSHLPESISISQDGFWYQFGHQNKPLKSATISFSGTVVVALVQPDGTLRTSSPSLTVRYFMNCFGHELPTSRGHRGQYNPVNSSGSAVCDMIITTSVFYYLHTARTGLFREDNHIQKAQYGICSDGSDHFRSLNALTIVMLGNVKYYQDNLVGKYFTTAPGTMKSKTSVRCILCVEQMQIHPDLNSMGLGREVPQRRWMGLVGGRSYWQVSLLYRTYSDPTESFTGLTVGLALYGVSACQYLLYVPTFRNDKRLLKSVVRKFYPLLLLFSADFSKVFFVFALDTLNTITLTSFYCRSLIFCRWNTSYTCTLEMPWDLSVRIPQNIGLMAALLKLTYPFKSALGTSLIAALVQFGFGVALLGAVCHSELINTLFVSPFSPVNALGSAICDAIITTSIYFYLRSSRAGLLWKDNYIQKLNFVFVRMGVLTCLGALAMTILYYYDQKSGSNLTTAPGAILGKTYANSMLAVHIYPADMLRCERLGGEVSEVFGVNQLLGNALVTSAWGVCI
ncbi:hypothetical protein EDD16DRAFT_1519052 [Pisolithus croceorrhizus]|nr:hypothetical protein EDD16DRAFT_1519052 [Pisolithus croceorrhizus]